MYKKILYVIVFTLLTTSAVAQQSTPSIGSGSGSGAATPAATSDTSGTGSTVSNPPSQALSEEQASIQWPQKASTYWHKSVKNRNGDTIGKIEDLVTDQNGKLSFAILSHGGFLGIGDKLIPVPLQAFKVDEKNKEILANLDKKTLESAPNFDSKQWPSFTEPEWYSKTYTYWKVQPDTKNSGKK